MITKRCTTCHDHYETPNLKTTTYPICTIYEGYMVSPVADGDICGQDMAQTYALWGKEKDGSLSCLADTEEPTEIWVALGALISADQADGRTPTLSYIDTERGEIDAGEITLANGQTASLVFCLWEALTHAICDDLPDSDDPEFREDDFDCHPLAEIRDSGSIIANGLN